MFFISIVFFNLRLEYAKVHKASLKNAKTVLSKHIEKSNSDDLYQSWGESVGRGYQNEENFEFYTF